MIERKTLVYDLECSTPTGDPNPKKDKIKLFACYSYITNKFYILRKKEDIEKVLEKHKYFVGFNNEYYDNQVLYNNGFKKYFQTNKYGDYRPKYKISIDLHKVFKMRKGVMKTEKGY